MAKKKKKEVAGTTNHRKSGLNLYQLFHFEVTRNSRQIRSRNRDFQKRARRHGTIIDGTITSEVLRLFYCSLSCRYCGKYDHVTVDHLVPLSRGGAHSIHNIVMACSTCNVKKGNKTIIEFLIEERKI